MVNRTFKIIDMDCLLCEHKDKCSIVNIPRDDIYQSLKDAKLYTLKNCQETGMNNLVEVKEEL